MTNNELPRCPLCLVTLTYVEPGPEKTLAGRVTLIALESHIYRCAAHDVHGLWQVTRGGAIVPYPYPQSGGAS